MIALQALGELSPREVLSPAEERFERIRRTVGLFLGPLTGLLVWLLPLSLESRAHHLAAILSWVVIYWVTEAIPIPITALLGPIFCILAAVGPAKDVLAPFANPVIFLFIGSFFIAQAMLVQGLDRRMALAILSRPWIGSSPARLMLAFGAITGFLSMWMSNTATTAMMFPIAVGILGAIKGAAEKGHERVLSRYATGLMLMVAYSASVGGIGTLVGTPPNLIGVGLIAQQAGVKISFLQWMKFAVPLLVIMFVVLFFLLYGLHPAGGLRLEALRDYLRKERERLGKMSVGEKNAAFAFLVAVVLWVSPGVVALATGTGSPAFRWFDERLPESVVALVAAALLFILPVNWSQRRFTLDWNQAAHIDWGTILLFGGGLSLGDLMFKTGLADVLGRGLVTSLSLNTLWGLTAVATALGIVVSELTSNTASANMVIPVMIAMAKALNMNPVPPAIAACLGASYGFMLPISTPPNAIVYGSGLVPITKMLRAGILFDLLGFFLIWLGLRLLLPLLGMS